MKQNAMLVLLSVVATLLVVVVVQNMTRPQVLHGQLGGGSSVVGPIGVATSKVSGGDAAGLWLYLPEQDRLLVYTVSSQNQLILRSARNTSFDRQLTDFSLRGSSRGPTVKDVQNMLKDQ